jgi:hypothetical protein
MSKLFGAQAHTTESTHTRCCLLRTQGWSGRVAALSVSTVIVVGVSGCQQPASSPGGAATTTTDATPASSAAPPSSGAGKAAIGSLPNLVGRGLQNAQDAAQAAGFFLLTSHDALGRGRHQILDREWKVCFQNPTSGAFQTSSAVNFGVVKLDESCPASDQAGTEPEPVGAVMPNLIGKSVAAAKQSLGSNASISFKDATGAGRKVLVASNWQICAQDPAPGKTYGGAPVTLTVTKFTESC